MLGLDQLVAAFQGAGQQYAAPGAAPTLGDSLHGIGSSMWNSFQQGQGAGGKPAAPAAAPPPQAPAQMIQPPQGQQLSLAQALAALAAANRSNAPQTPWGALIK